MTMKLFYKVMAAVLVLTVLVVWFSPEVADHVEQVFQRYLGRAAR